MASSRLMPRKRFKEDISKCIVVSNIPPGTKEEALVIHFQQRKHGGGDVSSIALASNGDNAIVTFEDAETVETVLTIKHKIAGRLLKVDRCQAEERTAIDGVFLHVTATMDPTELDIEPREGKKILDKIKTNVGVSFEYKERQFLIRGSLREINECHALLQKYLVQDENISDKFSKFSLDVEDVSADEERTINTTLVALKTHHDENTGMIIATPVYDSDEKELVNEKLETEKAKKIVNPMISDIQTFKVDPLALRFIRQFYKKQMQDISKECLVSFDGGNIDTQVTVKPRQECDPIRYNDACSRFVMLLNSASQGMTTWELDLKAGEEEPAVSSIRFLLSKYPVVMEKLQENGPFVVYGDSASVEQVKLTVQGRINDEAVGDVFSFQQLAAVDSESVSIVTYSYCTEDGVNISLRYGDITAENVDAIVNPANDFLQHGAGLAKYIAQKGGNQLIQTESDNLIFEKRRGKRLNLGEAVHTEAGNLPCKYVIHAVGPEWGKQSEEKTVSLLEKACFESLNLASKLCLLSIALPAISSGVFRVPIELCAFAMLNGVLKYLEQRKKPKVLKKEVAKKEVPKGANAEKNTDRKKQTKEASCLEAGDVKKQEETRLGDIRFVLLDANAMDVFEKECVKKFPKGGENESSEDESV